MAEDYYSLPTHSATAPRRTENPAQEEAARVPHGRESRVGAMAAVPSAASKAQEQLKNSRFSPPSTAMVSTPTP